MAGRRRYLAAGTLLAAITAALGVFASAIGVQAATNPLQIAIQVGYHDAVKLGNWMPVTVDLTNHGAQVDGVLEIDSSNSSSSGGPPIGSAIYQMPVSLAPGAAKEFRTYVSVDVQGTIDARILVGGRVVQSAAASMTTTVSGFLVGVVSDD